MAFVDNFQDFIKYHAEAAGMTREEFMAVLMSENKKKPGPDPYHRGLDDEEVEDKEDQIKKQADMDDDDPDAYKEMPGDKEAREKGEVKTSKATKAYNKLYGEDLDEGTMSDIHQMAGEVKSEEEFIKRFFKEYGAKVKKTKDSEEWAKSLYNDMNESKVNERAAMGYDGHKGGGRGPLRGDGRRIHPGSPLHGGVPQAALPILGHRAAPAPVGLGLHQPIRFAEGSG